MTNEWTNPERALAYLAGKDGNTMDLLDRLLGHDIWTTRQFLDLAAGLRDELLDQEFDIGHKSVRRTLEHIIWNVECWTDLMKGNGVRSRPDSRHTINALQQRYEAAADDLLSLARDIAAHDRLNDSFLDVLDDPPQEKTFGGVLVHLATHGMHHRAQLLYMFRRLGVANLPEGDALTWERSVHSDKTQKSSPIKHTIDAAPTAAEMAFLDDKFGRYNVQQTGRDDFEPLNLVIRDTEGAVIAGVKAVTGWDWLYVKVLWVHEQHRGRGLGAKLLQHAEAESFQRGCVGATLSSYNFQAPEFYKRYGYSVFGQIDDYPEGKTMYFLSKRYS